MKFKQENPGPMQSCGEDLPWEEERNQAQPHEDRVIYPVPT